MKILRCLIYGLDCWLLGMPICSLWAGCASMCLSGIGQLHWFFYNVIFLVSSLLFYDLLEEVEIETESWSVADIVEKLKEHYNRRTSNWLLFWDFILLSNEGMIELYWVPYYFAKIGFGYKSILLGLAAPTRPLLGSVILMLVINPCFPDKSKITVIILALSFVIMGSVLLLGDDP